MSSDLLSALYGGQNFIYEMLDQSENITELCDKLTDLFIKTGKFQTELIPEFFGGMGSFYYHNWVPRDTIWHQEDATALMSPDLYAKFIKSCDEKIVRAFNGCIIHQHSSGFVPTDDYIKMGMLALELHIDNGGPTAKELYQKHISILKYKPLLIWGILSDDDLDWIFDNLPSQGLAINVAVDSTHRANELWIKYMG